MIARAGQPSEDLAGCVAQAGNDSRRLGRISSTNDATRAVVCMRSITKVFGEGGYWVDYDWDKAARLGMEASGLEHSGEYGFAPTEMYWSINHMVSPKEEALGCLDCHGDNGRMDWKTLGYKGDPMDNPKYARSK